jgi:hypothetical protein
MKTFMKFGLVALVSFGLGAAVYSAAIQQTDFGSNSDRNTGVRIVSSSTFIANFQQRDMNASEARFYPYPGHTVTVDMYVKSQYDRPPIFSQCAAPRDAKLVDKSWNDQSGMMIRSQFPRNAPAGSGANTKVCVYNFAFVVPEGKVLTDDWALVVDGSPFRKLNQVENVELALAD